MKPSNWDEMRAQDKSLVATSLLQSGRGQLIVSQALVRAIEVMSAEPIERRETSNIQDMEMLLHLFPLYAMLDLANKTWASAKLQPDGTKRIPLKKNKGKK